MAHKDIDGGWGWVVTFANFLVAFFVASANNVFAIVYVILVERFDSSAAHTAWTQALYNIFRFMLAPLATALSDKFGFRQVIIVGSVLHAVGFMLSAFATSVYQLYFTYSVISGIGASLTTNPANVAIVQYFDKKKGKALSLSSIGMEFGIIALSFTYTFLLNEYGYRGMMLITGALMLNCVIGGALIRQPPKPADSNAKSREMVTMKQGQDTSQTTPKATSEQEKKSCCSSFKERFVVMKNPTFCLYFLNLCVLPFGLQTGVIFILHYCVEIEPSLTTTHLSIIWTLRSISALVGKFVSGFIFDLKFFRGRRRVLHSTIGVAAGVLLMSLSLANSFYVVVVIVVGWGVLIQSFEANSTTAMNEFVPMNLMSSAIGLMMFSRGIGNLLGPYSGGLIKDFTNTYRFVFVYVGSVFTFFCTVFLVEYFVRKATRQRTAENCQNRI